MSSSSSMEFGEGASSNHSFDSRMSEPDPVNYVEAHVITRQPTLSEPDRRPIPISTAADWRSSDPQLLPYSGVDILKNVPEVVIQQTVEMNDNEEGESASIEFGIQNDDGGSTSSEKSNKILSHLEAENRFVIKYPAGESIFVAKETSHWVQRAFLGSSRGFSMAVIDQTQQMAFLIERKPAPIVCCCSCALQQITVMHPSGVTMGQVLQECSWSTPRFLVYDLAGTLIYRVVGPNTMICSSYTEKTFTIYSGDGLHELSQISHTYNDVLRDYQLVVTFPQAYTEVILKVLLIGTAFMLQYMFFDRSKRASIFTRVQARNN